MGIHLYLSHMKFLDYISYSWRYIQEKEMLHQTNITSGRDEASHMSRYFLMLTPELDTIFDKVDTRYIIAFP